MRRRHSSFFRSSAVVTTPGGGAVDNPDMLLVVADGTGSSLLTIDQWVYDRMVNTHGYDVTIVEDENIVAGDLVGVDFVWISGTVEKTNTEIPTLLRTEAIPVVCNDPQIALGLDMAASHPNPISGLNSIFIEAEADPLAAGLTGTPQVYNSGDSLSVAEIAAAGTSVAYRPGFSDQKCIYYYNSGQLMFNSLNAPDKRAGFFMGRDIELGVTTNTEALFDAMITYITT